MLYLKCNSTSLQLYLDYLFTEALKELCWTTLFKHSLHVFHCCVFAFNYKMAL